MDKEKKTWTTPKLVVYGTVEEITGKEIKPKALGSTDDFGIVGISNP